MDTTRVGISTFDTFAQQLWPKYRPAINLKSLDFSEVYRCSVNETGRDSEKKETPSAPNGT